jgi:hypothetical protein
MAAGALPAALDLMRRLPPRKLQQNLACTVSLVPDLVEELRELATNYTCDTHTSIAVCMTEGTKLV